MGRYILTTVKKGELTINSRETLYDFEGARIMILSIMNNSLLKLKEKAGKYMLALLPATYYMYENGCIIDSSSPTVDILTVIFGGYSDNGESITFSSKRSSDDLTNELQSLLDDIKILETGIEKIRLCSEEKFQQACFESANSSTQDMLFPVPVSL